MRNESRSGLLIGKREMSTTLWEPDLFEDLAALRSLPMSVCRPYGALPFLGQFPRAYALG